MSQILVIEDDVAVKENVLTLLEVEGYQVVGAGDGIEGLKLAWESIEGLKLAWERLPSLVICDIMLPGLDGFGVLAKLRSDSRTAAIPVIFLTALSGHEHQRSGFDAGVDDFITKPFTREELLSSISVRLARQRVVIDQAKRKLEDRRSHVTRNLPYEILTPLSVVLGFAELLMDESNEFQLPQVRDMSRDIYIAGQRLLRIVQNYLSLNELETLLSDPIKLEAFRSSKEIIAAWPVIIEICEAKSVQMNRKSDLTLQVENASLQVSENYFHKIIEELLDNAFTYSTLGSKVIIQGAPDKVKGVYNLVVRDFGRGMKIEQMRQISDVTPFNGKMQDQQGPGMGLVIVKCIVELYKGSMDINSSPGAGTSVSISLPLA
jgi:two-component system, sensor histidine kinase and response regulator